MNKIAFITFFSFIFFISTLVTAEKTQEQKEMLKDYLMHGSERGETIIENINTLINWTEKTEDEQLQEAVNWTENIRIPEIENILNQQTQRLTDAKNKLKKAADDYKNKIK